MINFLAFLITIAGGLNWLCIGLFQYDFVAGLFGWQASIFSRAVYIVFGCAEIIIVIQAIKNKGKVPIFKRKNKANPQSANTLTSPNQDNAKDATSLDFNNLNLQDKDKYNDKN